MRKSAIRDPQVLNHEHSIMARSDYKIADSGHVSEQQLSFDRMLETLLELTP
jgi:hypothetical protein